MGRRTGGAVGRITAKLDLCDSSVKPDRLALRLYTRTHAKDCNLDASTGEKKRACDRISSRCASEDFNCGLLVSRASVSMCDPRRPREDCIAGAGCIQGMWAG